MADRAPRKTFASLAAGLMLAALPALAAAQPALRETTIAVEIAAPQGTSLETTALRMTPQIERYLGDAERLQFMVSWSRAGRSRIVLKFKPQTSEGAALAAVRQKLAALGAQQPGLGPPDVAVLAADRQPTAYLAFLSERMSAGEITRVIEPRVRETLQQIVGVARVRVSGARREVGRIHLDRDRLSALGLTVDEIRAALVQSGKETIVEKPDGDEPSLALPQPSDFERIEELGQLTIKVLNGAPVRLRDVARIERGVSSDGVVAHFDGQVALLLEIEKRPEIDTAEAARSVRAHLPGILAQLPGALSHKIGFSCESCVAPRR